MNLTFAWRPGLLASAVAAVALVGAACTDAAGTDPTTEDPFSSVPTATETPLDSTPTLEATETPAEPLALSGIVGEVDASGVSGDVMLIDFEGQTEVTVTLTGLAEGLHANHIHAGSCTATGDIAFPLEELEADADGNATATTTLDVSIETLATGHYFTVHAEGDEVIGDAVGCADFTEAM